MGEQSKEAKVKAASTYNSAADHFDDHPLAFWDVYGRKTVERLSLSPGSEVLDVTCGTGASALPSAEIVGPAGKVIGVDLAEGLLRMGREKAEKMNIRNIEFRLGDMESLGFPDGSFDAVVCVFGIFFIPDMESEVAELWRMVKPGGKLTITTWGSRLFEPAHEDWKQRVKAERPELYSAYNPWDRITDTESVMKLMQDGGTYNIEVEPEEGLQPLRDPEDWWSIAMGSGLRWTIDQLSPEEAQRVKEANLNWVRENGIVAVETNVIYAVATKNEG